MASAAQVNHLNALSRRRRREETPSPVYAASGQSRVSLARDSSVIDAIFAVIYGSQTVAAAISAVSSAGMYNLISTIELIVGGKTLMRLNGNVLPVLYQIYSGKRAPVTDVANPGAGNAFSYNIPIMLPLNDFLAYFSPLDASRPDIREMRIVITWSAGGASVYTTASTITNTTGPTLELHTERVTGGGLDEFGRAQAGSPGYQGYRFHSLITEQTGYSGVANATLKVKLNEMRRYSRLIFQPLTSAGNGTTAVINSIKIINNQETIQEVTRREIERAQFDRYNVSAADQLTYWLGVAVIDFARPGIYSETDWVDNGADAYALLDVSALSGGIINVTFDTFTASLDVL
jgi:hypothetical protein